MKKTTKLVLMSVLTIAMCVSLIAGATFALFTSESSVNIAVSSGKVDVVATIDKDSVEKGSTLGSMLDETSITVSEEDNTITLDKIVPGDYVNFDLIVNNYSNVAINYRVAIRTVEDTGLFAGLTVEIDGIAYDGSTKYSDWTLVQPESEAVIIPVSISLPEEAGDEYQAKSCKIAYVVEAIQGNASVYNGSFKIGETAYKTLSEAVEAAEEGSTIEILDPGVYDSFAISKPNITIKGIIGKTKEESTVIATHGSTNIKMYDQTTIDSVWVDVTAPATASDAGAWVNKQVAFDAYIDFMATGRVAQNVTIKNCKIYGNDNVDYAILFCGKNITFENNYVEGFKVAVCAMYDGGTPDSFVVRNNTTKNVEALVNGYWGKAYDGGVSNITITNNEAMDSTYIALWDYALTTGKGASAINALVKNNKNATLLLTETDENLTIVDTDITNVIYQHYVDITGYEAGEYVVYKADGTTVNDNYGDSKKFTVKADGTAKVLLTVGQTYTFVGAETYVYTLDK